MSEHRTQLPNTTALREALIEHFGFGDIDILCADIENIAQQRGQKIRVSREMIGGDGLPQVAQRLIDCLLSHNLYDLMVEQVCKRREMLSPNLFYFSPADPNSPFNSYCQKRMTDLMRSPHFIDRRFVRLSLTRTTQEQIGGKPIVRDDARDLIADIAQPAMILLGEPGAGKSTVLRRLLWDSADDFLNHRTERVPHFVSLNVYPLEREGESPPDPLVWLSTEWHKLHPRMPDFDSLRAEGKLLLLLDSWNELKRHNRNNLIARMEAWRNALPAFTECGNVVVFTCRRMDYTGVLSIPQAQVQEMDETQMQDFLRAYLPEQASKVWNRINEDSKQIELYKTPYYLKLLVDQVRPDGEIPIGRAQLFAGMVRSVMKRELNEARNELFVKGDLLDDRDRVQLANEPRDPHALPEHGALVPALCRLAYRLQRDGLKGEGMQLSKPRNEMLAMLELNPPLDDACLNAARDMTILSDDVETDEIKFFHQLLQEYFAARTLKDNLDQKLVASEWRASMIQPRLDQLLDENHPNGLGGNDPLPRAPTTGWEETAIMASTMTRDAEAFINRIAEDNLPLAGRCAAAPDARVSENFKHDLRRRLLERSRDLSADLRARIAASLALGELGHPIFVIRNPSGLHKYIEPPMIPIQADTYRVGEDKSQFQFETPSVEVKLEAFEIGKFPVTNAEYEMFIRAGGYDDERWWKTDDAKRWRLEGGGQTLHDSYYEIRENLRGFSEDVIRSQNVSPAQKAWWLWMRNAEDAELNEFLNKHYPLGVRQTEPAFWRDADFNAKTQPVVGVCWHEARAYCEWLSTMSGKPYCLPNEDEWEVAARGKARRDYAYVGNFDSNKGNTYESHVRRTTPIGVYPNGETPDGISDMCGNVWEWTASAYSETRHGDKDRDDPMIAAKYRVVRGGAWNSNHFDARAAYGDRLNYLGFRLVLSPIAR